MSKRITGTVKYFNQNDGFGFITPDNNSGDVFVYDTAIEKDAQGQRILQKGQRVQFTIKSGPDSRYAANVVKL